MNELIDKLVKMILRDFPEAQAIYLYGSVARGEQRPDSDIDLAVLLPREQARRVGELTMCETHLALERLAQRSVDLVNLRLAGRVLQNQVVVTGQLMHVADETARREFEMLSLSYYMKLNEERADILKAFRETKRVYNV